MSALGSWLTGRKTAQAKFSSFGKQIKDPFGNHFADARDSTAADAICAALNAPVFFGSWRERFVR